MEGFFEHVSPGSVNLLNILFPVFQKEVNSREQFPPDSVGQESVVSDISKILIRNVRDESDDKFEDR